MCNFMSGHRKTARCKPVIMMDVATAMLWHMKKGRHLSLHHPAAITSAAHGSRIQHTSQSGWWIMAQQMPSMKVSEEDRGRCPRLSRRWTKCSCPNRAKKQQSNSKIWQFQAFMEQLVYQIQNRSSQLKIIRPCYRKWRSWVSRLAICWSAICLLGFHSVLNVQYWGKTTS